jgi:hypothetical protein
MIKPFRELSDLEFEALTKAKKRAHLIRAVEAEKAVNESLCARIAILGAKIYLKK